MNDDDDLLAAYDLSAWAPPPPPAGLVDAVVERVREPASATPLDTLGTPAKKSRWWIAAVAAAVAAIALFVGMWGVQRTPKDGQGEVTANAAQSLAIGPTTAALDPGTLVRWRREKRTITVAQPRGTAMWNVAPEDTVVIDAGAMVASVEASGASLRVEVEMISSRDARAVGISAATAVAVALVTIVVYEGTVRVHHDGQTVNVVPGAHYEVRPPTVAEPIAVGASAIDPRVQELADRLKRVELERDALRKQLEGTAVDACDEVSCVLNNYQGECCVQFKPGGTDDIKITKVLANLQYPVQQCAPEGYTGTVAATFTVDPDGAAQTPRLSGTPQGIPAGLVTCIRDAITGYSFPRTSRGKQGAKATFKITASCDADELIARGDEHVKLGMHAAALAEYESSLRCKATTRLYPRMVLAACNMKSQVKAERYFANLTADDQTAVAKTCQGLGIRLGAACDADALRQQGDDHLATGMDAAALAAFEMSMRCKPDPTLDRKALLAACRSKNAAKAKLYYARVPAQNQAGLAQVCVRNGIDLSGEPACDAAALRQKGDDALQTGADARALVLFEQSYACSPDVTLNRRLFLAACRSKNQRASQKYYEMVPAKDASALAQMCIRNGVKLVDPPAQPRPATPPATIKVKCQPAADYNPLDDRPVCRAGETTVTVPATKGKLKVSSKPAAAILIDGAATGDTTPSTYDLPAGKHKVTLQIGGNRYTWAVVVVAGETVELTKQLQ